MDTSYATPKTYSTHNTAAALAKEIDTLAGNAWTMVPKKLLSDVIELSTFANYEIFIHTDKLLYLVRVNIH